MFSSLTSQNYSIKISVTKHFFGVAVVKSLLLRDYTLATSIGKYTVLQVKSVPMFLYFSLTVKCYLTLLNRIVPVMLHMLLVSPVNANEKSVAYYYEFSAKPRFVKASLSHTGSENGLHISTEEIISFEKSETSH